MKKSKIRKEANLSNVNAEQVKEKIIELAKKGLTTEKIGLELKKEGIFAKKILGKRVGQILKEKNLYTSADVRNLEKIVERLRKHLSVHKHDYTTKRILPIKEARRNKLKQKYKE